MQESNAYNCDLDRNEANFQPLTPLGFLERAAQIYPERVAIIHGDLRRSYRDFYLRSRQLASSLVKAGIKRGDTVSVMLANTPAMLECHYGVPMSGAVLNTLNTRLDAAILAFMLDHAQTRILIVDREFSTLIKVALTLAKNQPLVIDYNDFCYTGSEQAIGTIDYENFLQGGDADFEWLKPEDEWDAISLNYTSGTTGDPKGVVYHHRGAYLLSVSNAVTAAMAIHPVFLWTVPMFHCNGWCFPWTLSVVAGTHICLRQVRAEAMYMLMNDHGVTHLGGAPFVMSILLNATPQQKRPLSKGVVFFAGGAPPPAAVLAKMQAAGIEVVPLYGSTETYGPCVYNAWDEKWDELPLAEQAGLKARQGVRYFSLEALDVLDPETMQSLPADGQSMGEVMMRGNIIMKGYFKNPNSTQKAFAGGWFHIGDLGVKHPDGYIQLIDRSKDIIISGGENISSIEVEEALYKHPAVSVVAVVAKPDDKWGETPCAFVEVNSGATTSAEELFDWCRQHLARYKCPRYIVFEPIPKTSTGKLQKFALRERARQL